MGREETSAKPHHRVFLTHGVRNRKWYTGQCVTSWKDCLGKLCFGNGRGEKHRETGEDHGGFFGQDGMGCRPKEMGIF